MKFTIVKFLLENGIDVNKKLDRSKLSALMCASHIGNIKICKLLLEKGAKADVVDEHGCTALKLASENGHKEICKLLLENGAAVDWRKENGIRSLVVAAQGGYKEICELLLENGADVNAENKEGWRALMSAAQEGHKEVCELLLAKGAKVDATDENGWTALMLSAQDGDKVLCILLIEKGAEVNLENCSGVGALMVAAQEGHKEVCELLLERVSTISELGDELLSYTFKPKSISLRELFECSAYRKNRVDSEQILYEVVCDFAKNLPHDWVLERVSHHFRSTLATRNLKMPQLAIPLRVIVLGQHQSPAIEKVLFLLGRMEVEKRLIKFLEGTVT